MLKDRVVSALIGIPVLLFLTYTGGIPLLIFVILLAVTALFELQRICRKMNLQIPQMLFYGSSLLFPLIAFLAPAECVGNYLFTGMVIFLLLHLVLLVISFPKYGLGDLGASYLGSCYISLLLCYLILIRNVEPYGCQILIMVFIFTWLCDIGAYFIGIRFGRRVLSPAVSPHKTIEGSIGGMFFCLVGALLIQLFYPIFPAEVTLLSGLLIGLVVQIGDLVESALKRKAGIKDTGDLIPGHGGILDRFDSILFSAPTAYFFIKFILF